MLGSQSAVRSVKKKDEIDTKIIIKLWERSIGIHKSSPATVKFDESNGI